MPAATLDRWGAERAENADRRPFISEFSDHRQYRALREALAGTDGYVLALDTEGSNA